MDFTKIKNPIIAERVRNEGAALVAHCHFGVQGLTKTEDDVKKALYRLLDTGFKPVAFDTEPVFVKMIQEISSILSAWENDVKEEASGSGAFIRNRN